MNTVLLFQIYIIVLSKKVDFQVRLKFIETPEHYDTYQM